MPANIYDNALPNGATRTGVQTAADMKRNLDALRDGLLGGGLAGFNLSSTVGTGSAEQPQFYFLKHADGTWIRYTMAYSLGCPSNVTVDVSTDSGASYSNENSLSYLPDSSLNVTSSVGGGASLLGGLLTGLYGKFIQLRTAALAHISSTFASGVHGMGSMAGQSAGAVAITGGTVRLLAATVNFFRGLHVTNTSVSGTFSLDFGASGYALILTGPTTFTLANLPVATICGALTVEIYNPSGYTVTWPTSGVLWNAATPLQPGAHDIFSIWSRDATTTIIGRSFQGIG